VIKIRKSQERGHFDHGWLETFHTFSFDEYRDPHHMGFRKLRVINEDRVKPGEGFPTHSHQNMEIITYVLEGALEHKDSMGNSSVIKAGEVQRMSAGTGVTHSEYNHSKSETVHFLQIWILTEQVGIQPGYEQKMFSRDEKLNQLRRVASRDGRDGSVTVHQDINLYDSILEANQELVYEVPHGRHVWIQVTDGKIKVEDEMLGAGDGVSVSDEKRIRLAAAEKASFLLFDLN